MTSTFFTGGTDVMDRKRNRVLHGDLVDRFGEVKSGIKHSAKSCVISAGTTVSQLAEDEKIRANYAGLGQSAGDLANPQIRNQATVGGCLTQATRCMYFRHPHLKCLKKGDDVCAGRNATNENGVLFDQGGCNHPHPSTLGMALLAYDATIVIDGKNEIPVGDLYGTGENGTRDHLLNEGELITEIKLPAPVKGEKSAYFRAAARSMAEWALCEVLVRLSVKAGRITSASIAVGGVSQVPVRLTEVEQALVGQSADEASLAEAAKTATNGATPMSGAEYKAVLLPQCIVACGLAALEA